MRADTMTRGDRVKLIALAALFTALVFAEFFLPSSVLNVQGVIAQLTVALSIYMTISVKGRGAVLALVLNALQSLQVAAYTAVSGNLNAVPGIVVPLTTLVIVHLLNRYSTQLRHKVDESIQQQALLEKNAVRLSRMAYYDALTGMLNRESFVRELEALCEAARPFALVFIDIDGFKSINDMMGHQTGDEVLRAISRRLREIMGPEDLPGRLGGDEFALIIRRDPDEQAIRGLLARFMEALRRIEINDRISVDLGASIGVALYPGDAPGASELIRYADTAMYQAKKSGKNRVERFTPAMKETLLRSLEIERWMLTAFEQQELYVVFQPQYAIADHALHGFEALARWRSPALGEVSPGQFIPMAEYNGLIHRWGKWILESACGQFMAAKDDLPEGVRLSVNISARQIGERDFPRQVASALEGAGMPPELLVLEITESSFITDMESAARVLRTLKALGVRLSLDDFGKGYSSLYLLKRMPLDELKIDRDYIRDLENEDDDPLVVTAMIRLAHDMGLGVIAEGVETEAQLSFLSQNGCDCMQGFLWGRPQRLDAFMAARRGAVPPSGSSLGQGDGEG